MSTSISISMSISVGFTPQDEAKVLWMMDGCHDDIFYPTTLILALNLFSGSQYSNAGKALPIFISSGCKR
jgi:hypothetical protein